MRSLLLFLLVCQIFASQEVHRRLKRRVVFSKNSKMFFRLNGKDNVIPWVQIFAHGWSIRVNFDLPDTLKRRHKFFKRDVHEEMHNYGLMNQLSCMMGYVCQYFHPVIPAENCGLLCEIANIIKTSSGREAKFFGGLSIQCDSYRHACESGLQ